MIRPMQSGASAVVRLAQQARIGATHNGEKWVRLAKKSGRTVLDPVEL